MPTARRSRIIAAQPSALWRLVADPHHMPRWWPGVQRMEGIDAERFTQVFLSQRGRTIRMDFFVLASDPPGEDGVPPGRRLWEQDLPGTPFERVLRESVTEVVLEPDGEGTRVTLEQRQKLHSRALTGGFLIRRAIARTLEEALDGLEHVSASDD